MIMNHDVVAAPKLVHWEAGRQMPIFSWPVLFLQWFALGMQSDKGVEA